MKVLLVHPQINSPTEAYSYGVGYLVSTLRSEGHQVHFLSLRNDDHVRDLIE